MDAYQRQAATSSCEATLVLAGPGAGKTTMLAGRVRFLLENGEQPERILCLTFSRKAAAAMRAKIATPGVVVSTFHAFCLGVLRARRDVFGAVADGLIDDAARAASLAELVGDGALERLNEVDIARERGSTGDLAREFDAELAASGRIDFAGMALRVVDACRADAEFASWIGGGFSQVLVDEYQDVSPVQEALVRVFFDHGATIWAVGDDDQSLYEFRAADVRRVLDFTKAFAGAAVISTAANYRCSEAVVAAARSLIAHNKARVGKAAEARSGVQGVAVTRGYVDDRAEAAAIRRAVQRLLAAEVEPSEIAILTRSNALRDYIARFVGRADVVVMTAHAAKGLEWDYVFVAGCEDGVWPSSGAPVEEERRIFYVAATRARIGVSFSYAGKRFEREAFRSGVLDEVGVEESAGATATLDDGGAVSAPGRRMAKWLEVDLDKSRFSDTARELRNMKQGRPVRSWTSWSDADDAGLEDLVERKVAPGEMARLLQRTVPEVVARVGSRGLICGGDVGRILFERSRRAG
ncbi:MAG: ATP-dependent helicase [Methylobacteriaceae bacterium]|nr:ATP-dependent helicase [Methylobacteriaceae bacterium]